ncbi:MAG: ROK family glucokinase [Clostridia bacterium]|nr:ROK family glucokinase [Clostridia bacterium]
MKYRIGVDMGGTAIKAGVIDENFNIVCSHSVPTGEGFETVVKNIADAAKTVANMAGLKVEDFPCVGLGTPGCISPSTGKLVFSNNTNWRNVPLRDELAKHLPVPVYIGNDANCAVIGETIAGAAKGHDNVVMITLGTGVGGGVIIGGKLFCGGDGMGAELGHTVLVADGYPCTCGARGCLEAYASVTGLIRQTKDAMAEDPKSLLHDWVKEHGDVNGKTVFDCAQQGDAASLKVLDQYTSYVANGLGGFINVFRPEIILVGGGVCAQGDYLLDPIREKLKNYVFAYDIIGAPEVRVAALGNAAGTIGAAYLDSM